MPAAKSSKETPLMKQYYAIKKKYPGAILLFRVGDFYETFGEDAITTSRVLDIILTKRANGAASSVELAGFPHHALDNYLTKLIRAGHRVAICDQLEDPKFARGVVKRGVTELVTPGLSFHDNVLQKDRNNYLAALHAGKQHLGISFLDVSTGEFLLAQGSRDYIDKLLKSFRPSEIIYCKDHQPVVESFFNDTLSTHRMDNWVFKPDYAFEKLTRHFKTTSLKGFGVDRLTEGIVAAGAVLNYLENTEHHKIGHISSIARIEEDRYVWLDRFTIQNLELVQAQQEGGVPLIDILDHTHTAMGARLLRKWLVLPLKVQPIIQERLNIVELLLEHEEITEQLTGYLKQIGDLERLISKVATGRVNPRELYQLGKSLKPVGPIKQMLQATGAPALEKLSSQLNDCAFLLNKLDKELKDDPPILSTQGNLIKEGVDEQLDHYRGLAFNSRSQLEAMRQKEADGTGINSLKVSYNKVFGYYYEVTNAHKDKVPGEWMRKQTLVNAERYITDELKTYETEILGAEEKSMAIEQKLFNELVQAAAEFTHPVQHNARIIATADCLSNFARMAKRHRYVKPEVSDARILQIEGGRHPVIEQQLPPDSPFIPNDICLDPDDQQIIIVTGPNMAGKSALLRQTALISLMAQMGSFVPADKAVIGLVDKVFTRVGASDNLARGESTFMVEMNETASIINNLSNRSLVIMDEIGRGTSTYDGISIAWSLVEYLHNHPQYAPRTLFATHYHELVTLEDQLERVKNFNVSVKEVNQKILFLRKLKPGGSQHSFGIHVAKIAGMPGPVIQRANEILALLEQQKDGKEGTDAKEALATLPKNNFQLNLFEEDPKLMKIRTMLEEMDINTLSPVEALLKLNEIKMIWDNR